MSFTSEIKKELATREMQSREEKVSALSAFIRVSGVVGERDGKPAFFIVSETEKVAEYFLAIFEELYGENLTISRTSVDRKNGRGKLVLEYVGSHAQEILSELDLFAKGRGRKEKIGKKILSSPARRIAYLQGAFLGGGSCLLPKEDTRTGYHLAVVFPTLAEAEEFCDALLLEEILAKTVERQTTAVAYIKSKELISDFLSVIGAEKALKKFSSFVEKRDEANRNNRTANCYSGNADKTARAAVRQVLCIRLLEESGELSLLEPALVETAKARTAYPTLSLGELAEKLSISKSCLNHRLRKLVELSKRTEDKREEL